ncbi:MAG: tRNA (N(6)-L-threonylcarbamoyladenosine(37)-C(2))-methylthiotransferase MtaB [Desulfuromonadales bacterium]|nr:tRNA (N(6)-L-threonylcarbamoyladenosine(37)-C(2))-methylthiotransferase MtaB [Desulfuromonadales bacterium]
MAIASLGCKVNQCDGSEIGRGLADRGFSLVPFESGADVYIINTCTVTRRTDYQSRQLIRRAARHNPQAVIVVTGCYAQTSPGEIAAIPGIRLILGNDKKAQLPDILTEILKGHHIVPESPSEDDYDQGASFPHLSGHTRAFLKIQDGCNSSCTYCIVPSARGASRSVPYDQVKRHLVLLGQNGYREAVLAGIHLGTYGEDLSPPVNIRDLIAWADLERPLERIRLSSLEPTEVSEDIVSYMRAGGIICPHLHIPLQSGDDRILAAMGRPYNRAFFRELLRGLFTVLPDIAIGLDVMAGFPGEDEGAFQQTLDLLTELPVAYFHVFPYSPRPGTRASTMTGQVEERIKKERAAILRRLGEKKRENYARKFIGRELSVLIEGKTADGAEASGLAENYLPVAIKNGKPLMINSIVRAIPEYYANDRLYGRPS